MAKQVLITAGLPYSNGDLHVGHMAGCYLPADIYYRYLKLKGVNAKYVCGSDDHGVAIVLSGLREDKKPSDIVNYYHKRQLEAFKGIDIHFDVFGSTSMSPYHQELSNDFFLKIHDKGFFSKESSEQFYDQEKEMFLPDRYVQGDCGHCSAVNQNGDQCENCGKMLDATTLKNPKSVLTGNSVTLKETTHWFLDLSAMESEVKEWLEGAVIKPNTKKYVESLLQGGLIKRSMTRDLDWGLPVPLNDPDAKNKVMYVWFDAPVGYISNTKEMLIKEGKSEDEYKNWWSNEETEILHYIGEDNTIFHCIIWIAMLKAQGSYNLPKGVIVNNFLNIKKGDDVEKISKSKKNAIWILEYLEEGNDPDYLRYYLTQIAPEKQRSYFDSEEFQNLCNSDLADTLGNFINRSLAFSLKFLGETLPSFDEGLCGDLEKELHNKMKETVLSIEHELSQYSTKNALKAVFDFARHCNKYFNDSEPWKTRKDNLEQTQVTLAKSIQCIYFLGVILQPFMPEKAKLILSTFGITEAVSWDKSLELPSSGSILHKPDILFKKIEN